MCFAISFGSLTFAEDSCDSVDLKNIRGQVTLPKNCVYQHPIRITEGNTTLDCQNSTFVGGNQVKIGLLIDSEGRPMSDVTIKNCKFRDFKSSGIRITWSEIDSNKGNDRREIYRRSPTHILLDSITVEGSGRNGIYIDDYVTDVILRNSTVSNSGGGAVYLEFSSKQNQIINNKFIQNGFRGDGKTKREAISIDSSSENIIERNLFTRNAAGSIFLYKNCGEQFATGDQVIRWMPSNKNVIVENTFLDEEIGVWVASRQSKNLSKWGCGDAPMEKSGTYYQDFADMNNVQKNTFCRTSVPIRNEGDNNAFLDNKFDSRVKSPIEEPVSMRQKLLGKQTVGTVIKQNKSINCDGF